MLESKLHSLTGRLRWTIPAWRGKTSKHFLESSLAHVLLGAAQPASTELSLRASCPASGIPPPRRFVQAALCWCGQSSLNRLHQVEKCPVRHPKNSLGQSWTASSRVRASST